MKRIYSSINRLTEWAGALMLAAMVLIVFGQVVTRYFFKYTPPWSEETSLLLMVWFGFLGVALGVAEKLHLRIDVLTEWLPESGKRFLDRFARFVVFGMGCFMVWEGWALVKVTHESTMAGTKLPSSVLYFIIPLAGVLVILHSVLQIVGINTAQRHPGKE